MFGVHYMYPTKPCQLFKLLNYFKLFNFSYHRRLNIMSARFGRPSCELGLLERHPIENVEAIKLTRIFTNEGVHRVAACRLISKYIGVNNYYTIKFEVKQSACLQSECIE